MRNPNNLISVSNRLNELGKLDERTWTEEEVQEWDFLFQFEIDGYGDNWYNPATGIVIAANPSEVE